MSRLRQAVAAAFALLAGAAVLAACAPEPAGSSASAPVASEPTAASSAAASGSGELPSDCAAAYSDDVIAELQRQGLPLNDPGITLLSTEQAPLLELLGDVPTLRCTWGLPGDVGLSTNVSIVSTEQGAEVLDALAQSGFACEQAGSAMICRFEQRGVDLDGQEYVRGETHGVEGDLWVSTSWVNLDPERYTEDVLDTLRR